MLFLLLNSSWLTLKAQRHFHMDIDNGLCCNGLTDLTLDKQGNMWIGSYNGLMKYSGTEVRCFLKVGTTPDAISSPEMHSITEDYCGNIWIGTTAGLNKIDPVTFKVEHYSIRSPFEGETSVGYIYSVYADKYDFIWFSTDVALFRFDTHTGLYAAMPMADDSTGILSPFVSYNGYIEMEDRLWISTGRGMMYYEFSTGNFYHRFHNPEKLPLFTVYPAPHTDQSDLELDANGNIWYMLNQNHLAWFNVHTQVLDSVPFPRTKEMWSCCYSIAIDTKQQVWIGTRHGGVLIFNPATRTFQHMLATDPNSFLTSDYIYAIERGAEGSMYVASHNGLEIIDLYDRSVREFTVSRDPAFLNLKYQSGHMTYDSLRGALYIPYYNYGIIRFDLGKKIFSDFARDSLVMSRIPYVQVSEDKLYAATKNGMYEASAENNRLRISTDRLFKQEVSKSDRFIVWGYSDKPGSWFVKAGRGKLYHFLADTIIAYNGYSFTANVSVSPDEKFLTYLTSSMDLVRINLDDYSNDSIDLQARLKQTDFSFANTRSILDDGASIWMSGQNGVLRYDYVRSKLSTYATDQGLSLPFTFSIVRDKAGDIWISTVAGIDRYDAKQDRFINFYAIRGNTYMDAFGSSLATASGELFFLFGNKLIEIHPEEFKDNVDAEKTVFIEEILVNGKNIDWKNENILENLAHDQNRLTFRFDLRWFADPHLVRFQYRLNENEWTYNDNNQVSLDGLGSGKYILQVRSESGIDQVKSTAISVPFSIKPPFWKTWWFITSLVLCALFFIIYYFRQRIKRIRERSDLEIQMVKLKSTALKAQMNPHFVFNSLNAIQECIMTGRVEEAYTYLSKFSRLLRMVLEYADKPAILLQDELEILDLYLSLEQLRFRSDMHYQFNIDPELDAEEILLPPMILQPHLENAVWHGLRHKQGDKSIIVTIKEYKSNYLEITISDNGIGREKAAALQREKISTRQYRSMGSKLSQDQLALLQQKYPETAFTIIDKKDDEGNPIGTEIFMILPMLDTTA